MESNSCSTGLRVSGCLSADCTLLITDLFGLFPASFQKLVPMLETRYRIITYTDNGFDIFGLTKQLRHETMQGYADDLIAFLHENKIHNVIYLAHSVNALIAFHAVTKEPVLFDKIILLAALPCLKQDRKAHYQCGFGMDADINILFENIVQAKEMNSENSDQLLNLLSASFSKITKDKAQLIFNLIMATDCRLHLDKIVVPVMILLGINDKIATREAAYFMHRHIPDSYIIKIRAKGHLPQLSAPEEVFQAMEIFTSPVAC